MAVKSHQLGPGQLSIGAVGSTQEFGTAVRSATLTPEADDGDVITVLTGDELADAGDETWTLEGSVLQSYDKDSLILWCNQNTGKELDFTFIPRKGEALKATGKVLVRSIAMGGDVKTRNESDFEFKATNVKFTADAASGR